MKLQIMSDLHFEMHADGGAELIRELDPTGVDVLVMAGDITMARHYPDLASVFKPLARKYRHILYVPGNHEYYTSSPREVARNLARLTKELPEVVIPENDTVVIGGQRSSPARCGFGLTRRRSRTSASCLWRWRVRGLSGFARISAGRLGIVGPAAG
jgi:predicted MPP superfamily phosphohydrolase